jgi:hypothetical protein
VLNRTRCNQSCPGPVRLCQQPLPDALTDAAKGGAARHPGTDGVGVMLLGNPRPDVFVVEADSVEAIDAIDSPFIRKPRGGIAVVAVRAAGQTLGRAQGAVAVAERTVGAMNVCAHDRDAYGARSIWLADNSPLEHDLGKRSR